MGFEDLDEAAGEQSTDERSEDGTTGSETETAEATAEPADEANTSDEGSRERRRTDPYEEPAFPFVQGDMQTNVYVREQSRDDWEEARKFEVDRLLHEHGVEDVAGREHHDAIFRLATDHPELWARYVMEARGLDVPDDLADE